MKVSEQEAHICMGDREVQTGSRVLLFKNICISGKSAVLKSGGNGPCEKKLLGKGTVQRTLNEHYSLIMVDPGVQFEEGTTVEKE